MKNSFLILLFCLSFGFAFGAEENQSLTQCSETAKDYGSEKYSRGMSETCFQMIKDNATDSLQAHTSDQKTSLYSAANLVYLQHNESQKADLLAGSKTGIGNVLSMKLSEEEKRFYLLTEKEGDSAILSFPLDRAGNLAPLRKLKAGIERASDFAVDFEGKKLWVISTESSWVKSFNLHADPDGRTPANATLPLDEISYGFDRPRDIAVSSSDLAVLDLNRILIFKKTLAKNSQPEQILEGLDVVSAAVSVTFKENALLIENQEGVITVFKKNSEGFYVP